MNTMGRSCMDEGSCSSSVTPTEQPGRVNSNGHPSRRKRNNNNRNHRRNILNHPNGNIILISAAMVLLLTSTCSPPATNNPGIHWLAHAFEPSSSIHTHRPSLLRPTFQSSIHNTFSTSRITIQLLPILSPRTTTLYANTENNKSKSSSWSKSAMATTDTSEPPTRRRESRIGVRRRVKSVLKKARRRTGIRNNSEEDDSSSNNGTIRRQPESSITSVVADAAAIGGLGAVIVDEETGQLDVAFDYIPPKQENGVSNGREGGLNGNLGEGGSLINANGVNGGGVVNGVNGKTAPASTYSPPINQPKPCLDESLVVASPTKTPATTTTSSSSTTTKPATPQTPQCTEMDIFKSDVSAAFSLPPPPLPFTLPTLTTEQKTLLRQGERVQFQSEMGREGSGFVCVDVAAPASVVWNCLLDFRSYPQTIPTVQNVFMEDSGVSGGNLDYGVSGTSRAAFTLSKKFKLRVSVVHEYRTHPLGDYLIFTLDKRSQNFVLNKAKGVWYTESEGEGLAPGNTRVWLLAELKVSRILPRMIVDYAAKKAMPRATNWIKPHVETAASLWLKPVGDEMGET